MVDREAQIALNKLGKQIGAAVAKAIEPSGRLKSVSLALADRCARIVELRAEIRQLQAIAIREGYQATPHGWYKPNVDGSVGRRPRVTDGQ